MKNNPKYIVIHGSDVSYKAAYNQYVGINSYHRTRDFPVSSYGLYVGYHALITGGRIYACRADTDEGAHCNQLKDGVSMNLQSLGICVGFDGDIEDMPGWGYTLLQNKVWEWQDKYNIPNGNVYYHREFNKDKTCPGTRLDDKWLEKLLIRPPEMPTLSTLPTYYCTAENEIIKKQEIQISNLQKLIQSLIAMLKKFYGKN